MDSLPPDLAATTDLAVAGMTCASCTGRVERALARLPGVRSVAVSLATERARVTVAEGGPDPAALAAAIRAAGYDVATEAVDLAVSGMSCASCVGRVERALRRVPGVLDVAVNLATERARVTVLPGTRPDALRDALHAAGYDAAPPSDAGAGQAAPADTPPGAWRAAARRLNGEGTQAALAALLSAPLLAAMALHALAALAPHGHGPHAWMLPGWWQFALALPVQFWLGARFYRGAWQRAARRRRQHGPAGGARQQRRVRAQPVVPAAAPTPRTRPPSTSRAPRSSSPSCCSASGWSAAPVAGPPRRSAPWPSCAPTPFASCATARKPRSRSTPCASATASWCAPANASPPTAWCATAPAPSTKAP